MATLTVITLLAGSLALAGGAITARNMEDAPPEPEQVVQEPDVPAPQSPVAVSNSEPVNTATAPSLPIEEPVNDMAGGAIGRPPWGIISSEVTAQAPTTEAPATSISSIFGIKEDPMQLRSQLIALEREIETANFDVMRYNDMIAEINKLYVVERTKYITELSKSKQAETTAGIYQKKLSSQGQQKGAKDPEVKAKQDEIDKAPSGSDERKRLEKEKQAMMQAKPASDAEIDAWTAKFSKATADKVAADDDKIEAERQKNKFGVRLQELRTRQDEKEKVAKELIAKRTILLARLNAVINANVKKDPPPADWDIRAKRFARADKDRLDAERRLKQFYSETWLPLQNQPSQEQYRSQFDTLLRQWKSAKAELELARAALTASAPESSISSASSDFTSFVADINDITLNAVKTNGMIKDEYVQVPGSMRGYSRNILQLKKYAERPKLAIAADVYYQIAKMDSPTLLRNTPRFLSYFEKVLGSAARTPESDARPMPSIGRDLTKVLLKDFVQTVLGNAANDVLLYPGVVTDDDAQAKMYAELREKTNEFVDTQLYYMNKMFKNIRQARKSTKLSNLDGKNILDLEAKAKLVYPILEGVPPMGQCARIFKPSTLEMLRTGKRNGKDILTEVFETPTLKDEFLKEIGFVKVSSFLEAQQFGKQRGINPADAIDLIKKAAFEEYTKNAERLAYEQPDGQSYVRVGGDWAFLNAMNGLAPLINQTLNELLSVPLGGRLLPNQTRAQQLRAEANLHPFVPGVFLESNRLAPGPVAGRNTSIEPISEFRRACEIDGNVGSGKEEADRIIAILDKLRDMEIQVTEKPSELLALIDKLTKVNKINNTRPDQGEAVSALNQKGFGPPLEDWLIMKVTSQDKRLNFIQTFLTFRSSLFRTIPYDDTVVYNGKNTNTREVYSNLVFDEIQKMPSFDVRTDAEKTSFPSDDDWTRLSNDFNLNFVIVSDQNGVGRIDMRAANRVNTTTYYVFKEKNNRYFPVRMNAAPVGAPGLPRGQPGGPIATFNRGILGGAIDGIKIPLLFDVTPVEQPGFSLADTTKQAYNKFIQPWHSHDMSCITNRGKQTFYENVTEGVRQEKCVIKLDKLKLQLCKDAGVSGSNNLGRGGFKDAFCAVVEQSEKLIKGTKVALLYYRKSGEEPDVAGPDGTIPFTQAPHVTEKDFIDKIGPSLKIQEQTAKLNIAPQLYSYGFVKGVGGFAVVEFVNGKSLADIFKSNQLTEEYLLDLLKSFLTLGNINITQNDTNSSNFIWKDGRFIFIDDLSSLYKPGRGPKDIAEHFSMSTHTLMMMIMSGTTDLEKDFYKISNAILKYKIVDARSFKATYRADATIVKNDFHSKIVDIFAEAIPDATTFVKSRQKPGEPTAPTTAVPPPIAPTTAVPPPTATTAVPPPTVPTPPTTAVPPPTASAAAPTPLAATVPTVPTVPTTAVPITAVPPPTAPAPKPKQKGLKPGFLLRKTNRKPAPVTDLESLEGGSKWRRSKPSRYTRRKF